MKKARKKISLSMSKLEQEYIEELKTRTGMNDSEILKLAISKLRDELCKTQPQPLQFIPYPVPVPPIIINPPVYGPYVAPQIQPWIQPWPGITWCSATTGSIAIGEESVMGIKDLTVTNCSVPTINGISYNNTSS
jgi:hypothetical protein